MLIAKQKRRDNMAEYILYLWQLEDMFRALEFSPDKIYATLVEPNTEMDAEQKQTLFFWYMDMVNLLATEGKRKKGHLEHTIHLIEDINDLHLHLLGAPIGKEQGYDKLYASLAPDLPKLKAVMAGESSGEPAIEINDMEACFRALYSVVLCRLKGDEESQKYVQDVLEVVSPVVAKLVAIYGANERGEIDIYKGIA